MTCDSSGGVSTFYVVFGAFSDFSLIVVMIMTLFSMFTSPISRRKPSMIIISNLLISDSLTVLMANQLRTYIVYCGLSTFVLCTVTVVITRTFGYISTALLLFFSVERLAKISFSMARYVFHFGEKRLRISLILIWLICIIVGVLTTTNWKVIVNGDISNATSHSCTYSNVIEPVTGLISSIFAQILPILAMAVINIKFALDVKRKLSKTRGEIATSEEQRKSNQGLIKKVELYIFLMSLFLCGFNILLIFPICFVDIIEYLEMLHVTKITVSDSLLNFFIFCVMLYPISEAFTCFFLNYELRMFWYNKVRKVFGISQQTITQAPTTTSH